MAFQDNPQSILSFRVGPVLCCAPSMPVVSIITPPKLTHPPGSDRAQPGIFRHGSLIVKVIDLRQRFGIEQAEQTTPGNLIITNFGDESFAFWVDQILDVFDYPAEGWGSLPAAIPRGVFSRTLLLNKKIHLYAEFLKLSQLNDLGYLKHYIQQLKQNEEKSSIDIITGDKTQKSATVTSDSEPGITQTPANATLQRAEPNAPLPGSNTKTGIKNDSTQHDEANTQQPETPTYIKQAGISSADKTKIKAAHNVSSETENNKTQKSTTQKDTTVNRPAQNMPGKSIRNNSTSATKPVISPHTAVTPSIKKDNTATTPVGLQPRPATQTNTEIPAENFEEDTSSSMMALIFLLLFLAVIGAGIYLLISSETKSPPGMTSIPAIPALNETTIATEVPEENMFNSTLEKTTMPAEKIQPVKEEEIKPEITTTTGHRAEISHQENEITITIHDTGVEDKIEKESTATSAATEIDTATETAPQISTTDTIKETRPKSPAVELLKQDEVAKVVAKEKPVREIIHIVVKGDTLWAIAKKYVHNPFLYPELAQLSNIKNPHRIYPGDKVRIRFIKN